MTKKKWQGGNFRLIHIRLPEDVHKSLRIRAAELDTTMQDWVVETVTRELDRQRKRK